MQVYGWTDTPSILTGQSFIALSPHRRLQSNHKGLKIDFVAHSRNIVDQLAAFASITTALDKEFPGTIIRIPFRTLEQAAASEIRNLVVTPEDILKCFEEFQNDVAESMVFLKNIERVEFFLGSHKLGSTRIFNPEKIRDTRATIRAAIASSSFTSHGTRVHIIRQYNRNPDNVDRGSTQAYHVQQTVFDMRAQQMSKELRDWALKEKSICWIALAARLDKEISSNDNAVGRIFVTLPLPILLDGTRVNIHSMFALGRDRRSLWTDNDSHGSVAMEISWNKFLVKDLMPSVWHDMLLELSKYKRLAHDYFPVMSTSAGSLFNTIAEDVLKRIVDCKSAIWYSSTGQHLPLAKGLIVAENHDETLLKCLQDLSMPIFKDLPSKLIKIIRRSRHSHVILNPHNVRLWLRQNVGSNIRDISVAFKLLEYVSQDEQIDQLYGLPLFVCRNRSMKALQRRVNKDDKDFRSRLYIGTLEESTLFDKKGELFLLTEDYPPTVLARMQVYLSSTSVTLNLENFNLYSFQCYVSSVLMADPSLECNGNEIIKASLFNVDIAWIQKLWDWLDTKAANDIEDVVQSRRLIPLEGGESLHKVFN